MAKKKQTREAPKTWRPTPEDLKIIAELKSRLGVSEPDILRLAVRALAQKEGVAA